MRNQESVALAGGSGQVPHAVHKGWRWLLTVENAFMSFTLAGLVLLPVLEVVQRTLSFSIVSGATAITQHLTLVLSMLGAAVAAREGRLLALSTLNTLFKGWWKEAANIFSHGLASAISAFLVQASVQLIRADIELGRVIAYGIQTWVIQLVMPLGFGLVAIRLVWGSSTKWTGKLWTLLFAGVVLWIGMASPWNPENLRWLGLGAVGLALILGAPIFAGIGGVAVVLMWSDWSPVGAMAVKHYSLVTDVALPAIPLFTLAGYLLAEGGASQRLVRVFEALVGRIRGGPAVVTVLVCAYFTAFTGASGVTILALGGLLMPVLLAANFSERDALGLLTASGSLGVLLPPCLPLILYSVVASRVMAQLDSTQALETGLTIDKMFLAGLLPGLLLVGMMALYGTRQGPKQSAVKERPKAGKEILRALWDAKWELLIPVVALGALFGGFATPTEAAAITAFYAFFVEIVIFRDLKPRTAFTKVLPECGLMVGGVLLILGVAMGFTNYLVTAEVPKLIVEWVQGRIHSPWLFLLALNGILLVVGCLMDIFSAIVVVVPLIIPLGAAFGIDQTHLGIVFLANLQLGYLTPPVGMNLFLASYRFNKPIGEIIKASMPALLILAFGVLIITYVPWLATWLPSFIE